MKTFKTTISYLIIAAISLMMLSNLIAIFNVPSDLKEIELLLVVSSDRGMDLLHLVSLLAGVVLYLCYDNKVALRTGVALMTAGMVISLEETISNTKLAGIFAESGISAEVSVIVRLAFEYIGLFIYFVSLVVMLVYYLASFQFNNDESKNTLDFQAKKLKQWKQLLDENLITKEEFEEKRTSILKINDINKKR